MKRSSVRLRPNTTATASSSSTSAPAASPSVQPSSALAEAVATLAKSAEAAHDRVDFEQLVTLAEAPGLQQRGKGASPWRRVHSSKLFSLYRREDEVVAAGRVDACVEEVAAILGATDDRTHAAAMSGLYGKRFIAGSVAFTQSETEPQPFQQIALKASNFVRGELLGKNEQWCFVELLRRKSALDGFTVTQRSLPAEQAELLPARVAVQEGSRRVAQLAGISTVYVVERLPRNQGLRVVFHAKYQEKDTLEYSGAPVVTRKAVQSRMQMLARGVSLLSELVRRRRFGAQVLADRSAFDVRNSRCTCCTRYLLFLLLVSKTRCYLCGYYVCDSCSSAEKMETHNGRLASIVVCTRCRVSVANCNYDNMLTVSCEPVRVVADPVMAPVPRQQHQHHKHSQQQHWSQVPLSQPKSAATQAAPSSTETLSALDPMQSQAPSSSPSSVCDSTASSDVSHANMSSSSSQLLVELLENVIEDDTLDISTARRQAAYQVLEHLLLDASETTGASQSRAAPVDGMQALKTSETAVESVTRALDVSAFSPDPADCKLSNCEARAYPMLPALPPRLADNGIQYPMPGNEDTRLAAISKFGLHDMANVQELNMICGLAAAEMQCEHSVVTLVEREVTTLLATNRAADWDVGTGNPREQSFCQHLVMDDRPLLVRHAEADVRFYHMAPVVQRGLRFYAGFPIAVSVPGSVDPKQTIVVGALCCLDTKPHELTRSQYWRLTKLARAASQILQSRAQLLLLSGASGNGARGSMMIAAAS